MTGEENLRMPRQNKMFSGYVSAFFLGVGTGKKIPLGRVFGNDPLWAVRFGYCRDGYDFLYRFPRMKTRFPPYVALVCKAPYVCRYIPLCKLVRDLEERSSARGSGWVPIVPTYIPILLTYPNRLRKDWPGRQWIGGERGGKGGAMRAYQKWFWRDSIFSCDHRWSRRMRSFLFCHNSFSLSWSASYKLQSREDYLYLTRHKKLSRQFLLS